MRPQNKRGGDWHNRHNLKPIETIEVNCVDAVHIDSNRLKSTPYTWEVPTDMKINSGDLLVVESHVGLPLVLVTAVSGVYCGKHTEWSKPSCEVIYNLERMKVEEDTKFPAAFITHHDYEGCVNGTAYHYANGDFVEFVKEHHNRVTGQDTSWVANNIWANGNAQIHICKDEVELEEAEFRSRNQDFARIVCVDCTTSSGVETCCVPLGLPIEIGDKVLIQKGLLQRGVGSRVGTVTSKPYVKVCNVKPNGDYNYPYHDIYLNLGKISNREYT